MRLREEEVFSAEEMSVPDIEHKDYQGRESQPSRPKAISDIASD
jgi:hypothetical protein